MSADSRRPTSAIQQGNFQMIRSVNIENYRCFERLTLDDCARLNVIVGDNGSGKTALLEAIFLTLAQSPEVAIRFRQQRGMEGSFSGSTRLIEIALWEDMFFGQDLNKTISIKLTGDGPEARTIVIRRGGGESEPIPFADISRDNERAPIGFTWTDAGGRSRTVNPRISPAGFQSGGMTNEDLPDFFLFPANHPVSSAENATRFSQLSKRDRHLAFVETITSEYDWLESISIEVAGGAPVLYATMRGSREKRPLAAVSSGVNRIVGIMLGLATAPRSVVLVDEIENGIYFKHHAAIWRGLLRFMRDNQSQMFVSTHSQECLDALVEVIGDDPADVALWRIERNENGSAVRQFGGRTFVAGVETGGEVR